MQRKKPHVLHTPARIVNRIHRERRQSFRGRWTNEHEEIHTV